MHLTPEQKADMKLALRWGANVRRVIAEKGLKLADLGRLLTPDAHNPTSTAYFVMRRHTMPDDKTESTVASFLGVSKESLHAGEPPDLPANLAGTPRKAEGVPPASALRRSTLVDELAAGRKSAARVASSAPERRAPTPARKHTTKRQADTVEPITEVDAVGMMQRLVLSALTWKLKALDAGARYALLSDVARLCIDEG